MRSSAACWLSLALLAAALPAAAAGAQSVAGLTLDELMRRMATTSGVAARFHETKQLAVLAAPLETRGTLYFAPPDRLARFTSQPGFSALVIDAGALRFRDDAQGEMLDLSENPMARAFVDNFIVLFNGDRAGLERSYRAELKLEGSGWQLLLTPRHSPLDGLIDRISLRGDDRGLREMIVADRDGDLTTTVFDSVEVDRVFDPAETERLFSSGLPLRGPADER